MGRLGAAGLDAWQLQYLVVVEVVNEPIVRFVPPRKGPGTSRIHTWQLDACVQDSHTLETTSDYLINPIITRFTRSSAPHLRVVEL